MDRAPMRADVAPASGSGLQPRSSAEVGAAAGFRAGIFAPLSDRSADVAGNGLALGRRLDEAPLIRVWPWNGYARMSKPKPTAAGAA